MPATEGFGAGEAIAFTKGTAVGTAPQQEHTCAIADRSLCAVLVHAQLHATDIPIVPHLKGPHNIHAQSGCIQCLCCSKQREPRAGQAKGGQLAQHPVKHCDEPCVGWVFRDIGTAHCAERKGRGARGGLSHS